MVLKVGSWTSHINTSISISISISWESVGSGNFLALLQISRVRIFGRAIRKRTDLGFGFGKPAKESQGKLQSEPLPSWHHSKLSDDLRLTKSSGLPSKWVLLYLCSNSQHCLWLLFSGFLWVFKYPESLFYSLLLFFNMYFPPDSLFTPHYFFMAFISPFLPFSGISPVQSCLIITLYFFLWESDKCPW